VGDFEHPIESTVRDAKRALNDMSGTEQNIRYAIGSAAAAAAIFAPLSYTWKGVLTGVAAASILTGIYGVSPVRRLLNS
jgi:Protein of unknown function (DUF2892)